jgi:trans-aconitate 2-methyltransferase
MAETTPTENEPEMSEPPTTAYTFGDSGPAIERLGLMARLFAPGTDALLHRWAPARPAVAVDLGCGPGHTTEAIARCCDPGSLVAVDASPAMVAAARERLRAAGRVVTAVVADVTRPPLPGAPADLVHARYLLAHVREPRRVLDGWCTALAPGGRVLVDEIERIETTVDAFRWYLDTVAAMLADQGTDLYVGRALGDHRPPRTTVVGHLSLELPQPPVAVARMFGLNLAVWREGPWARSACRPGELDDLAAALDSVARAGEGAGTVTWVHQQAAWERPA